MQIINLYQKKKKIEEFLSTDTTNLSKKKKKKLYYTCKVHVTREVVYNLIHECFPSNL